MSSPDDPMVAETDVAIIGMTGRFPGADDLASFWDLLSQGREGLTRFSRAELAEAGVPGRLLDDPAYVPAHGVIPDVDLFDTGYFELTPAEAEITDPQHRLLLTAGHAALEHAGYDPTRFDGLISVYAGAAINTYLQQQVLPHVDQTTTSNHFAVMVGNDKDFLATRLSYKLNLKGPSYTIQTACSTSLVAVHLACQGLINGECDMALAGGVTVKLPQTKGYLYEEGAILSEDGHVRPFDADAGGTVLGNGVGVLVLKPLRDALADRDTVHAVIKGTATNNDGSGKVSFAAPGAAGQTAVIREAHAVSGVAPRSIGYVEAHGTGTRMGDPVEVSALTKAFRSATSDTQFCSIGSVKSNIGHLDAAAGVAGVIKSVLMMKHRTLVPTVNYRTQNPAIDFATGPFKVSTGSEPWTATEPRRAGVSSFGIGGTNAHAVLEEAPPTPSNGDSRSRQVLVLSARTKSALSAAAANLATYLEEESEEAAELADVAHTLAAGRRRHEYRMAVVGSARAELAAALRERAVPDEPAAGGVSFVFAEHVPEAEELAQLWSSAEPAFAEHHRAAMDAGAGEHGAAGRAFALQYALGRLWRDWGVHPLALHGDGPAALAAACVTGALELADGVAGLDSEAPGLPAGVPATSPLPVRGSREEAAGRALGVADGPWGGVARAWEASVEIDWEAWFAGERRGRVPLPTYPFEGRRCWMGAGRTAVAPGDARTGPHPMLEENVSTLDALAYRSSRTGEEFYLADHRVAAEPVMPAVGHLELARAAGELSAGGPVRLVDVSFERLLSYAGGAREVMVSVWREEDSVGFEIADNADNAEEQAVFAAGEIRTGGEPASEPADLTAVAARCEESLDGPACYTALREIGLDYGARMRALSGLAIGEREALVTLQLPDGASLDGAMLNPALLDGALHGLVLLLSRTYGETAGGFLPVALGELLVHAPVVGSCRAHVRVGRAGERSAHADVTVLDPRGRVLAELRDLVVRALAPQNSAALLTRGWAKASAGSGGEFGTALVVAEDAGRRQALADTLAALGAREVASAQPDDAALAPDGPPDVVLSVEPDPEQLLRLVQQLLSGRPTAPVRVLLPHRHEAGGARPERAALAGFARAVRAENPLLRLQVVGLAAEVDEAKALAAELAGPGNDPEVVYTDLGRHTPCLVPAPEASTVALRDGGVYLITGGSGGLGRVLAQWVLSRVDARVVLLSRSAPPSPLSHERVVQLCGDVTDAQALSAQLDEVRAEFGPLTGVVHAAGVLRDGFVPGKSTEDFAAVLAPKVEGLRAVDEATADDPLDFFVVFSSIAAHVGNAGQSDYAYANAFTEAYAERREGMTAVAWPMWADGGMRQTAEAAAEIATRTGFAVLPTATGLRLLERALGAPGAVVAAYGDTTRIASTLHASLVPSAAATAVGQARTDGAELRAAALRLLRALIASETGLDAEELDEDAPFDRYGIDSLMITKLNRELDRDFTGLSKTLFFEYATLGELATYFAEQHPAELGDGQEEPAAAAVPVRAGRTVPRAARRARTTAPPAGPEDEAVAIIGLSGRYPMADDSEEFWANLVAGRDCVEEIPEERWDSTRWFDPDPATPGRAHTRWGGFLRHVDRFDPLFFGISPRHAELMDPQERLFLQNAWHVLEDAGYRSTEVAGRPVGVYVGVMYGEYQFRGALDALRGGRPLTSSSFATIANRVSHFLDLAGPSLALDTMCSSSLTAIHLACESLRRGESELAIAGGVNVSVHPYKYAFLSDGRFLSSDGRCRAFGEGGDGYVPGEGVGAVLLKPYRQAVADGDRIHGVILGSAVNHGARTNGYTVPNPRAQQRAISTAMERAGVTPQDIGYVEAHGTGTALGDPIELTGLTHAYRSADAEPGRWPIGSVKSNVGHLESAAGVAGLTKVLLQFRHDSLVPSLHADELNPHIDFDRSPFRVQRSLTNWPPQNGPRRAGLSSFGAGGSNAHLVLEESPRPEPRTAIPAGEQRTDEPFLFLLSARDEERLRAYAGLAARFLRTTHVPLADVCFTTQVGRESLDVRLAVTTTEGNTLVAALEHFAEGGPPPEVADGEPLAERARTWLSGVEVDWIAWHASRPGPAPRRTEAPRYPFAEERYWIPLDPELTPAPHPLVDANESTVTELRFRKTLRPRDTWIRDHVIEGRSLFAGAATLEMVRAAADLAEPTVRHALREVVWGRAVELVDDELALYVTFRSDGEGLAFEVYSEDAAGRATHARGNAVPTPLPREASPLDLNGVRDRTAPVRDRAGAYADYRAAGFAYGPSFQVVDEIRTAPGEALLRLSASPAGEAGPTSETVALPPGLLDGALRACHWAGRDIAPEAGELPVPFSLGAVDVFAPLPAAVQAHARLTGESAGVRRFDISVYDERGRLLVSLRDFAGRAPGTSSAASGTQAQDQEWSRFYEPYWRSAAEPDPGDAASRTLALVGEVPELADALTLEGAWGEVTPLSGAAGELTGLLADAARGRDLDVVFAHALPGAPACTAEAPVDPSPAAHLEEAGLALLHVLRAAASGEFPGRVRCLLVHPQDGEEERPEWAALAGFARSTTAVARFELLTLGVPVDVSAPGLARALRTELCAASRAAGLEVRRTPGGEREVRALRPVFTNHGTQPPLRERGVYVVTGGAGAIGRVLTEHLARTWRARLVLIGRSDPDDQLLRELREHGAEVLAVRSDVTRAEDLAAALAAARERFGALHGVFHLAGGADDGLATDEDFDDGRFLRGLAAKTRGLVHLDQLTRDDALDLFVVFSSISSLMGDFGAASYATGNRFADLYTVLRESWVRRGVRHGRSLSLSWPLWSAGGVDSLVSRTELDAYVRHSGMRALRPEEGLALFRESFAVNTPWFVPTWGDPSRIDTALIAPETPAPASASATATGAAPSAQLVPAAGNPVRAQLVEHLRETLAGVLKLPVGRLDSRTQLDDYGLDSVLVMESNTLLGKDFPGLRGTVFFEYRTVDELADHVLSEHTDAVARLFPQQAQAQAQDAEKGGTPAANTAARTPVARAAETPAGPTGGPSSGGEDEPIAVIGVSGRYPQASDLDEFWHNLVEGRDCVSEVPAERWDAEALFDPDPTAEGRSYSRWGGFLSDVDAFDSLFFQISPKQARSMDPQERLFLETSWSALESAGYPPSRLPAPRFGGEGHDVGVFVGVMWDDYAVLAAGESARGNHQVVLANRSSIANQVSYFGDFRGPSVVVDTACSASLVAVHQACESIRRGECGYAIAGGVNVAVHPDKYVHLSRKNMLATDGRCRAFGAGGTGYVPGEGVGAVVLKRLSEAVRDGDTVHAVVRATAVNHGGRTSGFTVPNPRAQQALVEQALSSAGISARSIGSVEAHGTGTALGDPIEHTALAQAFAGHTSDTGYCALGSVKSSIGHLEGAAGIAGFTKAVLQLRHATLLPTLHTDELNPAIDFSRSPFNVQRETAPWPRPLDADGRPQPRRAAVSSFGAGGTNAHVILEEYVPAQSALTADVAAPSPELIVLSARDEERLRHYAAALGRALTRHDAPSVRLADVAHTLRVGREPMAERLAFVATDLAAAAARLTAVGRGEQGQWLHRGRVTQHPPLAGLFTESAGGEDFLAAQVRSGDDNLLGRLWVSGTAVDWDLMDRLRPGARRRIPLPTYPFARVRHWLDLGPATAALPAGRQPWRRTLSASEPVLRDHVVQGRAILPGVGHLVLVDEACGDSPSPSYEDVRWVAPLVASGSATELTLTFDGSAYELRGPDDTVRSCGRLTQAPPAPAAVDVEALRARLEEGPGHADFYRLLEDQGLPYGPYFRCVRQTWTGEGEALGRLGGVSAEGASAPRLHPGVLDAALHTVAALLVRRRAAGARPLLPFAADRVEVFGPAPTSGWSHVRETGTDRCDVLLLDDAGAVRVKFTGLVYREAKPESAVAAFRPAWTPSPARERAATARRVLIVTAEPRQEPSAAIAGAHLDADVSWLPIGPGGVTEAELDQALGTDGFDLVYFVGAAEEKEAADRAAVRAVMERGVVSFYRLVRALDRHGLLDRPLHLKVVTADSHPLGPDDASAPWSAGLTGAAMVVAKELPNLRVALVDVRLAEAADMGAAVAAEPFPARTEPVSLRAGVRRVRTLERVELPARPSLLRSGGVYLVIGGLGAVGRDTCHHLASEYGARLVVVGRSPLDRARREQVAALEAAGAEVRYLSLDAADPESLAEAVAVAKREFGSLHGVINAAMVLVNRVVRELPEPELRAALQSKTDTTWSLLHVLRGESLDFALFYSSAVAFEGNHGQTGYAAGCTFADAYALHAARDLPFPVRVLSLGYWHAGGDEDRERVLRRVAAAGIRPLTARQGMAVLERALAGGLPQLLALDADLSILRNLGVDPDRTLTVLPGGAPPALPEVWFTAASAPDEDLAAHQRAVAETEELAARLLAAVLHRAGVFARTQRWCERSELADRLGVVPEHAALFRGQLDLLTAAGYLSAEGDLVRSTGRPVETEAEMLGALELLSLRHTGVAPVATLLRDCLGALPEVLTGERAAMDVLFPDGSPERVAAVYRGDPVTDHCNAEVARLVLAQVEARLAAAPGTPVRVLEVGAGTGGTSAAVLAALAPYGGSVEYVFTDVSPAFVRKARARFGPDYPFARFDVLDIEADPTAQDGEPGAHDVVLGTNVLHATRSLASTLTRVKGLLRSGGALLVTEGTRPLSQLALVFGLTPGWWLADDKEQRIPGSPLASERQWRDVLAASGYRHLSTGSPTTAEGPAAQSVIAAVSDGLVPLPPRSAATPPARERSASAPTAQAPPAPAAPAGGDALEQVTAVFARVLQMTPDQLDPDLTFENYGVDSLVVLELTRALETVYGPQPATLLFEQITMRHLAEHLGAPSAAEPAEPTEQAEPEPAADGPQEAERLIADLPDEAVDAMLAQLLSTRGDSQGGGR